MSWQDATPLEKLKVLGKGAEFKGGLAVILSAKAMAGDYGDFVVGTIADPSNTEGCRFLWNEPLETDWQKLKGSLVVLDGQVDRYKGEPQLKVSGAGLSPYKGEDPPWRKEMFADVGRAGGSKKSGGQRSRSTGGGGGSYSKPPPTVRAEDLVDMGCWAFGEFSQLEGISPESAASMAQTTMIQVGYGNVLPMTPTSQTRRAPSEGSPNAPQTPPSTPGDDDIPF